MVADLRVAVVTSCRDAGLRSPGARRADRRQPAGLQRGGLRDTRRRPRLAAGRDARRCGLTQEQVAARRSVPVAGVSRIETGDVSTQDVVNQFVAALGGILKLIADFGDAQFIIA
jgi:hypothetical protein